MARAQTHRFEYAGFWLESVPGSDRLYVCWYDKAARTRRRRSLGTSDFEAAKARLIEHANAAARPAQPDDPSAVSLASVLHRYIVNHADALPSADQARYAATRILRAIPPATPVSECTPSRQRDVLKCLAADGLSAGYISRVMSVLSAAFKHAVFEGDLQFAPPVVHALGTVAKTTGQPQRRREKWLPTVQHVAAFLDTLPDEDGRYRHVWRYAILALATGARPDAILDLTSDQIDWDHNLLHLNPSGRAQTHKYRPTIRMSRVLRAHLSAWDAKGLICAYGSKRRRPQSVKNVFRRSKAAMDLGHQFSPYSLRHFVNNQIINRMRAAGVVDFREQAAWQLGHVVPNRTTNDEYIEYTADFMSAAAPAIDSMFEDLARHTTRDILRSNCGQAGLAVVAYVLGKNGGRDWD